MAALLVPSKHPLTLVANRTVTWGPTKLKVAAHTWVTPEKVCLQILWSISGAGVGWPGHLKAGSPLASLLLGLPSDSKDRIKCFPRGLPSRALQHTQHMCKQQGP